MHQRTAIVAGKPVGEEFPNTVVGMNTTKSLSSARLQDAIAPVADNLLPSAKEDTVLLGRLQTSAHKFPEHTDRQVEATVPAGEPHPVEPPVLAERADRRPADAAGEGLTGGRTGDGSVHQGVEVIYREAGPLVQRPTIRVLADEPLPKIELRLRVKATGSRWAADRRRLLRSGADFDFEIKPHDREVIDEARQIPDCRLWMNLPSFMPGDVSLIDDLAGCFEVAADAVAMFRSRGPAVNALEKAFGLSNVDWIATKPHESYTGFESHIARPDVALVLLTIRFSSHSFSETQEYCRKYKKPLVRLPGGYNPNQVAKQIMSQCGRRLKASLSD